MKVMCFSGENYLIKNKIKELKTTLGSQDHLQLLLLMDSVSALRSFNHLNFTEKYGLYLKYPCCKVVLNGVS